MTTIHILDNKEQLEIYYIPSQGFVLGIELGFELGFELGIELGFELGFESAGKYHPVLANLHNHKWLKKISKKVSSGFETVQCILSSILCPSIFREILKYGDGAISMARRFSAR